MMKRVVKPITVFVLAQLSRAVIRRYHPKVVMVTGSVGKTSTKDAVAAALSARFFVRKSEKSFNSELGVPFTVLGVKNPWGNPIAWFSVVKRSLALLILPNHYPNMLVLEVGADRPGDLEKILRIALPDAVVVTKLPEIPVHVEAYPTPEDVREEEFSPAYALKAAAPLAILAEDEHARDMAVRTSARVITYGDTPDAQVRVGGLGFYEEEGRVKGMTAGVETAEGEKGELVIEGSVGRTQLLPAAAAVAMARAFGIPLPEALEELKTYEPPPGRGRIFAGKRGSVVIDDSYNASPAAMEEALATLKAFPRAKRRIAILGDMLELGRYSVMEHERIGALARASADLVVAVGIRSRAFAAVPGAGEVVLFDNAKEAGAALGELLAEGDVILVKGSQSIRTERIVKELLADHEDIPRLVRQEPEWLRRS